MRIVVDLQGAQTKSRFRGIGRYTLSFTKALIRNYEEHEFVLILNGLFSNTVQAIRDEFSALLPPENILVWYAPGPVNSMALGNSWRRDAAELIREAFIESLQPDLVQISSFLEGYSDSAITSIGKLGNKIPVCVSLYDLIPLTNTAQYLDPYPLFKGFYLRRVQQLKYASLLFAISDFCRREGLDNLDVAEDRVINVSSAVEPGFQQAADYPQRQRYFHDQLNINRAYILYTGGADERKNLPRLLQVFAGLPEDIRSRHQLVFAGKLLEIEVDKLKRNARKAGLTADEFILTGYVSDSDLVQLYSRCELYVFPSWHEGFGLPALEAMACGAAVVGARSSSLVEVIANDAALFDPYSIDDMSRVVLKALTDPEFREELRGHSTQQAQRFSWDRCAQRAMSAVAKLAPITIEHEEESAIIGRLITRLPGIPTDKTPTDLQLARIADCLERNAAVARRFRSGHPSPR